MIKVAIVDDRPQNRYSIKERLLHTGEAEVIFMAQNGKDFLEQMAALKTPSLPQVVLMDIEMPVMDGIAAVGTASITYPDTRYLMLTVFDDDDKIFDAIKAGAAGYLLKDESVEKILNALKHIVEDGGAPMSPRIARKALNMLMNSSVPETIAKAPQDDVLKMLSDREAEILKHLVDGMDHIEVAEKLFLSPHTVRKHIANIYAKLHVKNRSQVVKMAMKRKWFMLF
jgi:DNA-binding NarL/FixJ family response regulator